MKNIDLIKKICDECIQEGESVLKTKWVDDNMGGGFFVLNPTSYVELEVFNKWKSNCNVLINILGDMASPWRETFIGSKGNALTNATSMLGALKSMKDTIDKGYLIRIEDLVFAEAFANLIEQSEYLFDQNYFLAAGVIARAVLEEKLRNLCFYQNVIFVKPMPTLSDYNNELYKAKFYDKIEFKNIDHLISIGNNAAHNQPFKQEEIKKLIGGVKDVLLKFK
jgi:hypothetical protein